MQTQTALSSVQLEIERPLMQCRPTLKQILNCKPFDVMELAIQAKTSTYVVKLMLQHHPVSKEEADAVLKALSEMHGTVYTRETVDVSIHHGQHNQEETQ
jgi:hypothetical protein